MPIYEYICKNCSKGFELIILNKKSHLECPFCHSEDISRKPSVFGIKSSKGFTSSSSSLSCNTCSSSDCSSCGK